VSLAGKNFRVPIALVAALLGAGCSGINVSQSISPASFFLPGFGQTEPSQTPAKVPAINQESVPVVAQVN
jgi:hypothetical protein